MFSHIYLMLVVIIGWVFFYFTDITRGIEFIGILFGRGNNPLYDIKFEVEFFNNIILFIFAIILSTPVFKKIYGKISSHADNSIHNGSKLVVVAFNALILIISTVLLVGQTYTPFLYFKF